jgi:hypothetical protein
LPFEIFSTIKIITVKNDRIKLKKALVAPFSTTRFRVYDDCEQRVFSDNIWSGYPSRLATLAKFSKEYSTLGSIDRQVGGNISADLQIGVETGRDA